jgi:DNA repair protein RecO (recombination protein O)
MPGLYKDEGIVLKTIKLGEADRIVTLFMREQGKVRAVAKGIRKTKSRFGARLEPFTRARLIIYRGRNLDTITSADIITSFDRVRTEYPSLVSAAALAELVEKMTPDREQAFSTYALLLAGLHALADGKGATVVPAFLVKLLSVSGYHPQLRACAGCGRADGLGAFSPAMGGAVCRACWTEDRDAFRMGEAQLELLARLLASEFGEPAGGDDVREVTQALRLYAEYHLERPLRSLHLLSAS